MAEGYCHQKGIFPAREAVVMQQQARGVTGVTRRRSVHRQRRERAHRPRAARAAQRRRRSADPEPRLSAVDGGGHAERRQGGPLSLPARERLRAGSRKRSRRSSRAGRAPSSSSIPTIRPARSIRAPCCEGIARLAERNELVVFSDEIYDQMTYDGAEFVPMATLVQRHAVLHDVGPLEGLSRLRLSRGLGVVLRATCAARATIFARSSC